MEVKTPNGTAARSALAPPFAAALSVSGTAVRGRAAGSGPLPLIHSETYIGLLESNDIVLNDPAVSRIHAVIRWSDTGYVIQDLGSVTGTLVDGSPISGPTPILPGQHIRIGSTELVFQSVRVLEAAATSGVIGPSAGMSDITVTPGGALAAEATISPEAINAAIVQAQASRLGRWIAGQRPLRYWKVFAVGLLAYVAASQVLLSNGNEHLVPLVTLLASALVPVTFVVFCWEQGAFADIPPIVVGLAFVSGSTLGLLMAAILEPALISGGGFPAALTVGIVEEAAKAAAVVWFLLRDKRNRELDGLVLGAAAGMGFAALETAGYGFANFLDSFTAAANAGYRFADAYTYGIGQMISVLNTRMVLAVFGHGVWTAVICAAIWRERRDGQIRITSGVVLAFAISVGLHTLWDWDVTGVGYAQYLLFGAIGLLILRFFLQESLERARLGPDAPPPAPLPIALPAYLIRVLRRIERPVVQAMAYATAPQPTVGGSPGGAGTITAAGVTSTPPVESRPAAAGPATPPAATSRPVEEARYCAGCGVHLPEGARFCPSCGAGVPTG
ncbi:MAG TPA: PrsW family glutamic-type intramembrane protease [Thermomicrobiaceae bacterium]|nr:PrsW family glutamic-type intramembrane protease [Thermomicrobiaceae bacterium]